MNNYYTFENWLNKLFMRDIPHEVKAINFNLYEDDQNEFDAQCIGSPEYDPDDSDWACNELFTTGEDLCHIKADDWESCLEIVINYVKEYLSSGAYANKLTNMVAVTVGFVDGDLEVVFQK